MHVCATALWAGLGVALAMPLVTLAAASEQFHEALTIRPLASGEVVSTFLFRTLMQGTPRDPSHVGSDDYRKLHCVSHRSNFLSTGIHSAALQHFAAFPWSNPTRVRCHRAPSDHELWELEL
jgi:hypothetical protein